MAFPQEQPITPVKRGGIEIMLYIPDPDPALEETQYGRISIQLYWSDGSVRPKEFDLLARLQDDAEGQGHLSNLASLRDYIITRVESELLP